MSDTNEPTPTVRRMAEIRYRLRPSTRGSLEFTAARADLVAVLDLEEMAEAYGVAHFGRIGWDEAPAVIRNDVRERMAAVIETITGDR